MVNRQYIEASTEIAAPPDVVWGIVSDLRRMGQWSPQCSRMWILGGEIGPRTRSINLNRRGWMRWPTSSKVTVFEPEREIAFRITENGTQWRYVLEPTATGTQVTESRSVNGSGAALSNWLVEHVMGGADSFEVELEAGMQATLARIKAEAEQAA